MKPIFFLLLVCALAGCAGPAALPPTAAPGAAGAARQALTDFFEALERGDYAAAAALFGDDYEILTQMNPNISAEDHIALWKQGCKFNGFQCLKVKEIVSSEQVDENIFRFVVHFENADGTVFVQGPCCGEDETSTPPVSEFKYEVRRNAAGLFQVMDMPPYVP